MPRTLVTIADVHRGIPDPEPYLLGAQRLGVAPDRCLVVEDAPAGIAAAGAAGCGVLAVAHVPLRLPAGQPRLLPLRLVS